MKAQDLKNSILQLAIQGKLVPQDANDEPAEVLYAKIQAEKQKLIKEGKIKKDKPLPPITDDEVPFSIPPSWKWVRIGNVGYTQTGTTPSKNHPEYYGNEYPFVKPADIDENGQVNIPDEYLSSLGIKQGRFIPKESILMICIGSVGRAGIVKFDCSCNQQINALTLFLSDSKYILYAMCSKSFQTQALVNTSQTTLPILNKGKWDNLLIPLPPLAEQKRIVAKIEELEPLVKQYDKAEIELSTLNDCFPEQLKKSILQYAIQGKLVKQDTNDEPAEVLYAKIQAEKQKLIKEGKIKKDKLLPPITDDEIPFAIPSTWKWVRFKDLFNIVSSKRVLQSNWKTEGVPFYRAREIAVLSDYGFVKNELFISEDLFLELSKTCLMPEENDIMVSAVGTIGKPYIVKANDRFYYKDASVLCYKNVSKIIPEYAKLFIESEYFVSQYSKDSRGTTVDTLTIVRANKYIIPLPPIAEQKRIVAKVNELMQYCKELAYPEKRKSVEPITIEWLIDKGFDSCKQNGYTDVNAILDELNIAVMQDRSLKKGRIEYKDKQFQIWVNDLNDNWTKTHELVHYVNDNNEIKLYGAVGRKDETSLSKSKEHNVDALTAEILMPEDIFVSAVEQENVKKYVLVENAIIRRLGKQFRVSDDAVKIRLQNLGYHTK